MYEQIMEMITDMGRNSSIEEYKLLLEDIIGDCRDRVNALDDDENADED